MEFKEGAAIYTADGERAGTVERFVIDPHTRTVSGLVARQGFLFTEDKAIPVELVASATAERIDLRAEAGHPDDLPRYEETYYIMPDDSEYSIGYAQPYVAPLYYYPPVGLASPIAPMIPEGHAEKYRNVPAGNVVVDTGSAVMSRDGQHVGDVQRVITDSRTNEVTHFVISQGLLLRDEKTVPMAWVAEVGDNEIHLAVNASLLEQVPAR
jgi:uncharacterized protein YrrD